MSERAYKVLAIKEAKQPTFNLNDVWITEKIGVYEKNGQRIFPACEFKYSILIEVEKKKVEESLNSMPNVHGENKERADTLKRILEDIGDNKSCVYACS